MQNSLETIQVQPNHKFNEYKLLQFLLKTLPQKINTPNPTLKVLQFNAGQSNPTYLISIHKNDDDENDQNVVFQCVLRKKPHGKLLKGAHLIEREYLIQSALYKQKFPVPETFVYCKDLDVIESEFYLMEYVKGRIFRDNSLPGLSPDERREIYTSWMETLVKLHEIDPIALGLENFGKTTDAFQRGITTWSRNYKQAETQQIKDMDYLIENLPKLIPQETGGRVSIVHGDFRIDNTVFHPTENRVIAVLDWELSTLGSSHGDLAQALMWHYAPSNSFHGLGHFDQGTYGIPNVHALKNQYLTQRNQQEIKDKQWFFFLSFNFFKLAGISQGVYKRSQMGNASSTLANSFGKATILCAKQGRSLLEKSIHGDIKPMSPLYKDFSPKFKELYQKISLFLEKYIYPNEHVFQKQMRNDERRWKEVPPIMEELKQKAKEQGIWNLFMPKDQGGLSNLEYAPLCELMGRANLSQVAFNCNAPDTGNMEVLHKYGSKEQQKQWLEPLLKGEIRSCFSMTEPQVASSDATNIQTQIIKKGSNYIVNGRKWYISMAGHPDCKISIVMGKTTNPNMPTHKQHSMILVPLNSAGVKILRPMNVMGFDDAPFGHMEVIYENVIVPQENIILGEGRGFEIAQGRLGPGRIHHCMRLIGATERAYDNLMDRLMRRKAFKKNLIEYDSIRKQVAKCRLQIDQTRLLVLHAAKMIDEVGPKNAKNEIAQIKVAAPNMALEVIDRVIQIYGAAGLSQDTILSEMYANSRTLRLADGPDEVHLDTIAKNEIERYYPRL